MQNDWKFHHVGILVNSIGKAIEHFRSLGVGPFPPFIGGPEGPQTVIFKTVRGKPSDYDMDLRLAESGMGQAGIELIQPLKGDSIYDEFLEKKGEGVHHIAFLVNDLDKEIAEMAERGFKVLQTGGRESEGIALGKWAYFDTDKVGGVVTELIQRL